jgi:hypothetical protein
MGERGNWFAAEIIRKLVRYPEYCQESKLAGLASFGNRNFLFFEDSGLNKSPPLYYFFSCKGAPKSQEEPTFRAMSLGQMAA